MINGMTSSATTPIYAPPIKMPALIQILDSHVNLITSHKPAWIHAQKLILRIFCIKKNALFGNSRKVISYAISDTFPGPRF